MDATSSTSDNFALDLQRDLINEPTTTVLGSEPNLQRPTRKTDFAVCRKKADSSPETSNIKREWSDYVVIGELKRDATKTNVLSTWLALASYAREVFGADGTRQRVLGFTLCNVILRLHQHDRLGLAISQAVSINTEDGALEILKAFAYFLTASDIEIGLDDSIKIQKDQKTIYVPHSSGITWPIKLNKVLKNPPSIAGRGTVIISASLQKGAESKPVILKYSWPYITADHEERFLSDAKDIDGVVRLHSSLKFYTNGKLCTVNEVVRKRLNVSNGKECDMTLGMDHRVPAGKEPFNNPELNSLFTEGDKLPEDRCKRCMVLLDYGEPNL